MAQEIVSVEVELYSQIPIAEHLFASQLIAGLFVKEATEYILAGG